MRTLQNYTKLELRDAESLEKFLELGRHRVVELAAEHAAEEEPASRSPLEENLQLNASSSGGTRGRDGVPVRRCDSSLHDMPVDHARCRRARQRDLISKISNF